MNIIIILENQIIQTNIIIILEYEIIQMNIIIILDDDDWGIEMGH